MGPALVIQILILGFLIFVVVEVVVARFLPKAFKPFTRGLTLLWIGYSLFETGVFGEWKEPPPQTVATLMEQVRGDELHWNRFGKPATKWEENNRRHYKKSCQGYAIQRLGELGPEASEAVPELIEIFNEQGDYNTGDGVLQMRAAIAKTLGTIGKPEAIEPMIEMLVGKSLAPDPRNNRSAIRWHDREYEGFRSYLKRGTGPQGILMGLMLMPQKHHHVIVENLKIARAKIEQSGHFNAWSKFEIDRGIQFFEADKKTRRRIRNNIEISWYLDDPTVEKSVEAKSVRPPQKYIVQLSNGKWSKEVSTEAEVQAILAEDRKARARAGK